MVTPLYGAATEFPLGQRLFLAHFSLSGCLSGCLSTFVIAGPDPARPGYAPGRSASAPRSPRTRWSPS